MNIKLLIPLFKVTIYFLAICWCLSFLIKIFEIETSHVVIFDDIATPKINLAMAFGAVPHAIWLAPIWKTIYDQDCLTTQVLRGLSYIYLLQHGRGGQILFSFAWNVIPVDTDYAVPNYINALWRFVFDGFFLHYFVISTNITLDCFWVFNLSMVLSNAIWDLFNIIN